MTGAAPLLQGLALGFAICGTLGPQSLFVLKQGIRRERAFHVATICTMADLLLISIALVLADAVVVIFPDAARIGLWGGAVFTLLFGCYVLLAAAKAGDLHKMDAQVPKVTGTAFAVSFANPQVYFEMTVLVGAGTLQFVPAEKILFALGVWLVSPLWFFGLVACGHNFSTFFERPGARKAFDLASGLLMIMIAATMVSNQIYR